MRHSCVSFLVFSMLLGSPFLAVAQSPPDQPALANPPRYGDAATVAAPVPQAVPAAGQAVPTTLILPAGTLVTVRLTETVSSDRNNPGDGFTTVLDQPIVVQGWVVSRRGQMAVGRVVAARKAGRVQGVSQLAVELSELVLVDGQQVPIRTQLIQSSAGTSQGRDVAGVGTTTGLGAVIGAAAGGGQGAAIGAAAGAVAGIAGVLSTRGRATELYPETILTFRLEDPVTVSTLQSQHAFKPVSQDDCSGGVRSALRNPPRTFRPIEVYPPYYYYGPYYYPGWYYGYYGFGPRVYVVPRVHFGIGGYRHRH